MQGAGLAQLDEQAIVCCMAESGRPGFESDPRPFGACLPLSLSVSLVFTVSVQ